MEIARRHLIEELAKSAINALRVRALCRDFPGIIATSGLRVRIWALLLLGPEYKPDIDGNHDIALPGVSCEEQHVLEADGEAHLEDHSICCIRNMVCLMIILYYVILIYSTAD